MCTSQHGADAVGDYDGSDYLGGIAAGSDGRIILAGKSYGSYAETNLGEGDLVGVMLNTNASVAASPTPAPSAVVAPSTPTTTVPPNDAPSFSPSPTRTPPTPETPATPPAPTPASNTAPTVPPAPLAPTPAPSLAATPATPLGTTQGASNVVPIAAGVASAVAGAALIALGLCLRKRQIDKKKGTAQQVHPPVVEGDRESRPHAVNNNPINIPLPYPHVVVAPLPNDGPLPPPYQHVIAARQQPSACVPPPYLHAVEVMAAPAAPGIDGGHRYASSPLPAAFASVVVPGSGLTAHLGNDGVGGGGGGGGGDGSLVSRGNTEHTTQAGKHGGGGDVGFEGDAPEPTTRAAEGVGGVDVGRTRFERGVEVDSSEEKALIITTSTVNVSTGERDEFGPAFNGGRVAGASFVQDEPKPTLDEIGPSPSTDRRAPSDCVGLGQAVGDAAHELARNCHIPGVSEAAAAVAILVNLVTDNRDTKNCTEASLRRCRSIVMMLQRAAKVLGKVS